VPLPEPCLHFAAHTALHLAYVPEAYCVLGQHSHDLLFSMEPRTVSLPLSVQLSTVLPTSYTLADQRALAAQPLQANVGTMETPSPYRCLHVAYHQLRRSCIHHDGAASVLECPSFVEPLDCGWLGKAGAGDRAWEVPALRRGFATLLPPLSSIHAAELGFRHLSFHHVRLTLTPRY